MDVIACNNVLAREDKLGLMQQTVASDELSFQIVSTGDMLSLL